MDERCPGRGRLAESHPSERVRSRFPSRCRGGSLVKHPKLIALLVAAALATPAVGTGFVVAQTSSQSHGWATPGNWLLWSFSDRTTDSRSTQSEFVRVNISVAGPSGSGGVGLQEGIGVNSGNSSVSTEKAPIALGAIDAPIDISIECPPPTPGRSLPCFLLRNQSGCVNVCFYVPPGYLASTLGGSRFFSGAGTPVFAYPIEAFGPPNSSSVSRETVGTNFGGVDSVTLDASYSTAATTSKGSCPCQEKANVVLSYDSTLGILLAARMSESGSARVGGSWSENISIALAGKSPSIALTPGQPGLVYEGVLILSVGVGAVVLVIALAARRRGMRPAAPQL